MHAWVHQVACTHVQLKIGLECAHIHMHKTLQKMIPCPTTAEEVIWYSSRSLIQLSAYFSALSWEKPCKGMEFINR
jgi:hypothetical protein